MSAALIPFLEHDDANRALMGSNMQRQAVPLLKTEPPLVATGMEERGRPEHEHGDPGASKAGTVTSVDATAIVIDDTDEYALDKFAGLNERTCLNQKPDRRTRAEGQEGPDHRRRRRHRQGRTGPGPERAGRRSCRSTATTSRTPSSSARRLVKDDVFTSIHIDEFNVEIRETKLGREEFTRDIPNVSEKALRNLDENGVVREGTRVGRATSWSARLSPRARAN